MTIVPIKGVVSSDDDAEVYHFFGYSTVTPSDVEQALADAGGQPVTFEINSPGGEVAAGSEISAAIQKYSGRTTSDVVGNAASAASLIALSADKVEMAPVAQLMIHRASSGVDGNVDALNSAAQALDSIDQALVDVYSTKTGMSPEDVYHLMVKETWINAKQAVEMGFADDIIDKSQAPVVTNAMLPLSGEVIQRVKTLMVKAAAPKQKDPEVNNENASQQGINPKLAILLGLKP
ncbi:head maturation protease, ClpP-related [Lacticaseibacillus rhamnosus]|nr:head maturation protease, ClpP-related [Lacticaseibacillus rhamnosus]